MKSLTALAVAFALAAAVAAPCSAAGVAGPSGAAFRGGGGSGRPFGVGGRSPLLGAAGDRGFIRSRATARPAYGHRRYGRGYGWGGGYYGDLGYPYDLADDGYFAGPGPFGPPPPPYGDSFARGYGAIGAPMAEGLAPRAYGPGAHDGAYAYGYNGYAQTPQLPQPGASGVWPAFPGLGRCGC